MSDESPKASALEPKRGECWRPDCAEKVRAEIKVVLRGPTARSVMEFRGCRKHMKEEYFSDDQTSFKRFIEPFLALEDGT